MAPDETFFDIGTPKRIHLMGVGGAGMSGLALLLHAMGHDVSGCDVENTFYLEKVRRDGVDVVMDHHKKHLDDFSPELIVHTSAIARDHPELIEAKRRGIVVARRAEILRLIFNERQGIGIAGTHGKTTTSSMVSLILERAGFRPTVAIGGELSDIGCNAKLGDGPHMVAELDESDGSFELFSPSVSVVTNIDWDHIDHYPTFDSVREAFGRFLAGRKPDTPCIVCAEDPGVHSLLETAPDGTVVRYGWGTGWEWGAVDVRHQAGGGVLYTLCRDGTPLCEVALGVSGDHNVLNSLAAIAAAAWVGVPMRDILSAMRAFTGAKRRLQFVGECADVVIYDDYGHHPREIEATMRAVAQSFPDRPMLVAFQPHRYTRTEALYRDFARVLQNAQRTFLLPIYAADELPMPGVSSFLIAEEMEDIGKREVVVCGDFSETAALVAEEARPGDVILTLGAGNIDVLSRMILEGLRKKTPVSDAAAVGA